MKSQKPEPTDVQPKKDDAIAQQQDQQTRNLSGFSSLDDVAKVAPDTTVSSATANNGEQPKPKRKYTRKATSDVQQQPEEVDPRERKFFNKFLGDHVGAIHQVPYEIWSYAAQDSSLCLSDDEKKDFADWMYVLAKRANITFDSTRGLIACGFLMHFKAIGIRYAKMMVSKGYPIPDSVKKVIGDASNIN